MTRLLKDEIKEMNKNRKIKYVGSLKQYSRKKNSADDNTAVSLRQMTPDKFTADISWIKEDLLDTIGRNKENSDLRSLMSDLR